jgi:hypothetical protein
MKMTTIKNCLPVVWPGSANLLKSDEMKDNSLSIICYARTPYNEVTESILFRIVESGRR